MKTRAGALVLGLVIAAAGPMAAQGHEGHDTGHDAMHATPPSAGLQAELIRDVDQLESKFMGLARAMQGRFDWRPGEGVRSVGEVFGHVAGANFMIPSMAGVAMPSSMEGGMQAVQALEQSGDEARIREALEHSFTHVRHALAEVSDAQMEEMTRMFGQEATKRQVLTLVVTHMHEHLGQSIAYARMNGVTPPWSGGN